jgi:Fic family protein
MQYNNYKIIKFQNEEVKAYIPPFLDEVIQYINIDQSKIDKINRSLGRLDAVYDILPNINLFIYLYIRKEALLSSQIEGTQSSLTDLFSYEAYKISSTPYEDVEEVANYIKAINNGLEILKSNTLPFCNRLLKEMHAILMQGVRGVNYLPGEFRRSQNWIGGTRPGNSYFVPPPPEYVENLMSNLEKFVHKQNISPLIKIALIHAQFETIHPFLDGNGRLGRLLITLLLHEYEVIKAPILYISYYMKAKQSEYYQKLQGFRSGIDGMQNWIDFFLEVLEESAKDTFNKVIALDRGINRDAAILKDNKGSYKIALKVFNILIETGVISMPDLSKKLGVTLHTIIRSMSQLEDLGLVKEVTGKKSNRMYSYSKYTDLLNY